MIARVIFATEMQMPMSTFAADANKAEETTDRRCASCRSLSRTGAMLEHDKKADRPAHLSKFLRSHSSRLPDDDERHVIELLSGRGK